MNGKLKAAIIIIAVIITSGIVSFVSVVAIAGKSDRIFPGVTVKGIYLGNMTREEASQELKEYSNSERDEVINAKFEGGSGGFRLADIGFQINTEATLDRALSIGRRGNIIEQWQERKNIVNTGIEIPVEFSLSKDKLREVLDSITKGVRVPPRDARLVVTPQDTIEIVESSSGRGIDLENAFDQVLGIVKDGGSPQIEVRIVELKPAQTTGDVRNMMVNGEIARFTTSFDIKKTNRVYNIRVAASALDGQVIKAGEFFSFNKVVGPRSQEAGYKLAPTILNNEFIDSLGGGVCQVSTTLYNTLLQADLEVLQRSSHSLTIKYVPLGQDAAVAYGGKDLKFKNNLSSALIIKTSVSGNKLTVKLFGDTSLRKTVKIINSIIKEYPYKVVYKEDLTKPKGKQVVDQKGVKGYRVTSKMLIYQGNNLISKKSLPSSYYSPLDEIILVGTKPSGGQPVSGGRTGGGTKPFETDTPNPVGNEPETPPITVPLPDPQPDTPPTEVPPQDSQY